MSSDDQIAYLAGDDGGLSPDERAEMEALGAALADPAVWVEPSPDLEERVVSALTGTGHRSRSRAIRYALVGTAATVLLALGLAIGLNHDRDAQRLQYAATLSGTSLAPHASGEVTLTKTRSGWKIHLHATGLPRRDDGAFYEAWLRDEAGVLIPVGTFNEALDVVLWAGVPPTNHPTFTVTRELADGTTASSGEVVLTGPTHRTD